MPVKIDKNTENPAQTSVKKYRRIKTIVKKAVDTADLCGVNMNIIIYDDKFHRLREFYTSSAVKLEVIGNLMKDVPNTSKSKQKVRELKFWSINARLKDL